MGLLFLLLLLAFVVVVIWMHVRILHKAGFSGWWFLLLLIPVVNIIMVWVFAYAKWPNAKHARS